MNHTKFINVMVQDMGNETSSSDEDINILFQKTIYSSTSSESDEEIQSRQKRHRVTGFVEEIIPSYTLQEFQSHFRVNKTTCEKLINLVETSNVLPTHTFGREKVTSPKAVLLTLWYLSNLETYRQVSDRFNVTPSCSHSIITKVIDFLVSQSKKHIYWPTEEQKQIIRDGFHAFQGIQHIIGAIDGCHITIKKPQQHSEVYCNRKSQYSILLQAICNHQKKFLDVFCGEPGSVHDARLLKKSSIYEKGMSGFLQTDILIGDSAYPCLSWLITPFRDNGQLTENQKTFNFKLSSSRIIIENAFALLKGRFRRLKYFENDNTIFIVKCVIAATVLHNICIDAEDIINDCRVPVELMEQGPAMMQDVSHERRNEIFQTMFS